MVCERACARAWCGGVLITTVFVLTAAAPDSPTWPRPQPQQTLMELVLSIDDKLRSFDGEKLESSLRRVEAKLDSLEAGFKRLDSSLHDRMDKLDRNLNAKELKDELIVEKLTHKVRDILDTSYDRYTRRLGYTEERIDMSMKKVQMNMEGGFNRLEKLQEDIQTEVVEAITILEDLKAHSSTSEDKLNSTHKALQQHIQSVISPSQEHLQRISGSLDNLGARLNSSAVSWTSQSDSLPPPDLLSSVRTQISSEANRFTNKVNNMFNDLWRRIGTVEGLVRDANRVGNMTHRELMEELRSLPQPEHRDFAGESQENFLAVGLDALDRKVQRRLSEVGRRLDDRLDTVAATQSLIMDSCFEDGVCHGLEGRLSNVLEKIFDVYTDKIEAFSNSTLELDRLVMEMMDMAKTQHSQLIRTVTHNTNMVVRLTKEASQASKELLSSVDQLGNKTDYYLQGIHDEIQDIPESQNCNTLEKARVGEETTRDTILKNVTEKPVVKLNITTPAMNTTVKHYTAGVLRITTEDNSLMADNSSVAILTDEMRTPIEPMRTPIEPSALQIIGMLSPNLTQDQMESLLHYLNSTVSVINLEAIIQNTEAESSNEDEMDSEEVYDSEFSNSTTAQSRSHYLLNNGTSTVVQNRNSNESSREEYMHTQPALGNSTDIIIDRLQTKMETSNSSNENEHMFEDMDQTEFSDFDSETKADTQPPVEAGEMETSIEALPDCVKEQIKVFALLMKIKNTNVMDILRAGNESETTNPLLPVLHNLCYGDSIAKSNMENVKGIMRVRLHTIRQTISDTEWYEKVETICNKFTESHQPSEIPVTTHHSV